MTMEIKKKCAISSVFYSKSMVFILPGALVVYQGYTIFYYGKFVQCLINYGTTLLHYCMTRRVIWRSIEFDSGSIGPIKRRYNTEPES